MINTIKFWVIGSFMGLIVSNTMFYVGLRGTWIQIPMLWLMLPVVPSFVFLMGLMLELAQRDGANQRKKSGEDKPDIEWELNNGRIVVYGNTVKVYHGGQQVRISKRFFLDIAEQIKKLEL